MRKWIAVAAMTLVSTSVWADGGVNFVPIDEAESGITYSRFPTPEREARVAEYMAQPATLDVATFNDLGTSLFPHAGHGMPGLALIDYDNDGDLDIYVTNGPGVANSLYANQFSQTGAVTFIDVAAEAGVEATEPEGSGVCYGDMDNDGDADLYVVTVAAPNILYMNNGDGTFVDVTEAYNAGSPPRYSTSCSFADFNGDSYLDIVIANTYDDWNHRLPFVPGPSYSNFEHNVLLMNTGEGGFVDTSNAAGLEVASNMDNPGSTGAAHSWVVMPFDYDLDGDIDVLFGDNQGPPPGAPEEERGYLRLYENDGTAHFTEVTLDVNLDHTGGWMGLDAGDFNCDGNLDFFGTNVGFAANEPSRPFMGSKSGVFDDIGVGDLNMTPFGWGVSVTDYDNDGDGDVLYHGGFVTRTGYLSGNAGVLLENQGVCSGNLDWEPDIVSFNHNTRMVLGMAMGDLNHDGFEDVVTVSNQNVTPAVYIPMTGPPFFVFPTRNSPFEATARFEVTHAPFPPGSWTRLAPTDDNGVVIPQGNGNLMVELNSADNGNNWVELAVRGGYGVIPGANTNRDGIGATIFFTPDGGKTSARPIFGGASFGSQDSLNNNFGLGDATSGTAIVQWPNGVQNRLGNVQAGESVTMVEVPCDFSSLNPVDYLSCVRSATQSLVDAGAMTPELAQRYVDGAFVPCDPDSGVNLCLEDGRFKVEVDFVGHDGTPGQARVTPYGDSSGIFWFFNEDTIEMHLKLIDGCDFNGYYWVYGAASTDVEYGIFVTDLEAMEINGYFNAAGNAAVAVTDSTAFMTCP